MSVAKRMIFEELYPEEHGKWSSVMENAPHNTPLLLWDGQSIELGGHSNGFWWNNAYKPQKMWPTHWRYLPDPPNTEGA